MIFYPAAGKKYSSLNKMQKNDKNKMMTLSGCVFTLHYIFQIVFRERFLYI